MCRIRYNAFSLSIYIVNTKHRYYDNVKILEVKYQYYKITFYDSVSIFQFSCILLPKHPNKSVMNISDAFSFSTLIVTQVPFKKLDTLTTSTEKVSLLKEMFKNYFLVLKKSILIIIWLEVLQQYNYQILRELTEQTDC